VTLLIIQESDYLSHVGVLGMRWGHHKTGNKIKSKTSNIEKWGTDKDHNILYVTGYSGSGKSTLAIQLKNKNTNVIHLDPYFEKIDKKLATSIQDKEFNNFLDKNFPDYKSILKGNMQNSNDKQHWANVDNLMLQTEKFAVQQFPKKKVIVEGVQLSDNTTYPNKDFFKDKPLVITETSALKSIVRAGKRDGKTLTKMVQDTKLYMKNYSNMNQSIDTLSKTANTKKGKDWVDAYLAKQTLNN